MIPCHEVQKQIAERGAMKRSTLPPSIRKLARRVATLQAEDKELGLFTDDRELLTCPKCGLMEDVRIDGGLFTCRADDANADTGSRFVAADESERRFRCPACGTEIDLDA